MTVKQLRFKEALDSTFQLSLGSLLVTLYNFLVFSCLSDRNQLLESLFNDSKTIKV